MNASKGLYKPVDIYRQLNNEDLVTTSAMEVGGYRAKMKANVSMLLRVVKLTKYFSPLCGGVVAAKR